MRSRIIGLILSLGTASVALLASSGAEGAEVESHVPSEVVSCGSAHTALRGPFSLCIEGADDVTGLAESIESYYEALSGYLGLRPAGTMTVAARLSRQDVFRYLEELGVQPTSLDHNRYFYLFPGNRAVLLMVGTDHIEEYLRRYITKYFLFACLGAQAPYWFNQGLAGLLGNSRLEEDTWKLGLLQPYFMRRLAPQIYDDHFPGGLSQLVATEDYSGILARPLVHWLLTRYEIAEVLEFARQSQAMPAIEAWEATFGGIDPSMEEDFSTFLRSLKKRKSEKRWKDGVHQVPVSRSS